jgi:hypothetical protein
MADTPETSPLLKADSATIAFSANSDGSLRVRYGGWDEAKVLRPGESLELVARKGQVWAFRRGEPLKAPAPDPYKDWDIGASAALAAVAPMPQPAPDPNDRGAKGVHGQNDRGAKGE